MTGVDIFAIDSNVHNVLQLYKKVLGLKKCISVVIRFDKKDHVLRSAEKQNFVCCTLKNERQECYKCS